MSTSILTHQKSEFSRGLLAGMTIAIGYMPAALTFGLLAKGTGLTFLETVAMSIFIFAGASQYMALNLLAIGTGAFEIIFTTFIVNIRHLLMSAAVREKMEDDHPFKRAITAFGITDEVFAMVATQNERVKTSYIMGVALLAYVSWVGHSAIGYVAGTALPATLQQSMGIALYAMFIALLMPSLRKHRYVLLLAGSAALFNLLFSMFLPSGWAIICATLLASIGYEGVKHLRRICS
ncbi:AzlC family ABC transporter permease [Halalkalibacterium ligniniphilum]|uniref:AzlC family ABC transporter permease n=1 Tax=Halalkalibacterium ligniniphilum TaxID=1134413 RepID=UPI00034B2CB0|nr:AzlC family ABC transporter permease [Halalkalibacterium ligniniphilum]